MTEEQIEQLYKETVRRFGKRYWYLVGELEWLDGGKWQPESLIGARDLLWLQAEPRSDGVAWSYAVGSDPDNYYKCINAIGPIPVMEILHRLVNDVYIAKWGVRLAGMTEWIMRTDNPVPDTTTGVE